MLAILPVPDYAVIGGNTLNFEIEPVSLALSVCFEAPSCGAASGGVGLASLVLSVTQRASMAVWIAVCSALPQYFCTLGCASAAAMPSDVYASSNQSSKPTHQRSVSQQRITLPKHTSSEVTSAAQTITHKHDVGIANMALPRCHGMHVRCLVLSTGARGGGGGCAVCNHFQACETADDGMYTHTQTSTMHTRSRW